MKIITWNLCFLFNSGKHTHSGKEWEYSFEFVQKRIDYFANLFQTENADVIFLQELTSEEVLKKIIKQSGIDYSYFIATPDANGIGNAILLKSKNGKFTSIPSVSTIPVFVTGDKDAIGPRLYARRDFTHAEITYKNKSLHLLGIHLKSNFAMPEQSSDGIALPMDTQVAFADGMIRSELFRASQAKKARETIDDILKTDPEAQIIVAGDFNTQPSTPIFRMIQGGIKKLPDHLIATGKQVPESERYSILIGDDKYLADHILVSKNLQQKILSVQIRNSDLSQEQGDLLLTDRIGSDHAPVVLEIE